MRICTLTTCQLFDYESIIVEYRAKPRKQYIFVTNMELTVYVQCKMCVNTLAHGLGEMVQELSYGLQECVRAMWYS